MSLSGQIRQEPYGKRASDSSSELDAIYERNVSRVREIDAVLGELEPVMRRLLAERSECLSVTKRSTPYRAYATDVGSSAGQATPLCDADARANSAITHGGKY